MKLTKTLALFAVVISFGLTTLANAGQTFTLKGTAPAGARLHSINAHANLPFDKRYYELTQEQRDLYRARFDSISATQIPPFPRNGLQAVYKPLMDANLRGVRGQLNVNVEIDASGQVSGFTVLNAPSKQLAKMSEKILRSTQFDPGYCAGEPCKMTFPVQISYR